MPRTYKFTGDIDECEECGAELVPIVYKKLELACPECVPDGLIDAYELGGKDQLYMEPEG